MRTEAAWAQLDRARECLEMCELFRDLPNRQLMEVAAMAEEILLKPNEMLLAEGERARYIFVVLEGRGIAQLRMAQGFLSLGMIGPSDAAGWSSLVGDEAYPASVKALTPMRVARIDSVRLARLMEIDSPMGYIILKRLSLLFSHQYRSALEAFRSSA